jgi:rhomboid protease GluP
MSSVTPSPETPRPASGAPSPFPTPPSGPRPFSNPARPAPDAPYTSIDDDAEAFSESSTARRVVDPYGPAPTSGQDAIAAGDVDARLEAGRRPILLHKYPPHVAYAMIIANLALFVVSIFVGWSRFGILNGYESVEVLVLLGAKVNQLIAIGEWWRLFTAMFLHVGILHLVFNVYAIFAIGPLVESYYGHLRFALIYLIGGLIGSLASYAFSPSISAGASGAVFAIAAAAAVYFFRYRENFGAQGRAILQNMLFVLGANLLFGLVAQGIDNWGHFGGMVGGLAMGWLLLPHYAPLRTVPAAPIGEPLAPILIKPESAPLRVSIAVVASGLFLWLGIQAATSHWLCGSWLGC